jgi:hypothetical protein
MKTQTLTLAGYVWKVWPPEQNGSRLLMFAKAPKNATRETPDQKTKGIVIPSQVLDQIDAAVLIEAAHLLVTATYTERDGRLPVIDATKVEAFNGRVGDEWKDWY